MGMFDYVRCHYPLPLTGANDRLYQTKTFNCPYGEHYEISKEGLLWWRPRSPDGDVLLKFVQLTGELLFYDLDDKTDEWIEWSAYFVRGSLKLLNLKEHYCSVPVVRPRERLSVGN